MVASYNILRTYWELPHAPEQWRALLEGIDEIWVPNNVVAEAFRQIFPRAITIIPPCVEAHAAASLNRAALGLRDRTFYFLFTFDYFSFPSRKNPLGVLRAFQAAFPKGDERVGLIIKSTGSQSQFREVRAVIASIARRDPRIVVVETNMSQAEVMSLIASCDCCISLHRSEGFGLGMVETMLHGKPVIGTDFSGSTDFLSPKTGYPVTYTLRPVRRGEYIYPEEQIVSAPSR
ncbi:glycosyltransferase family 4 protein [Bosea sp. F3-2]|uniref:glycosyltransferase n=1 Tax=Bosea sp. F3-2 TaxID=2599640 RepID=UPI0011ED0780|nr:glycosyltransferase [Bosea sp. F3-2]QEL23959.1 glycosyltransferase family 4 protein [Bosea sp. F3-2]